MTSSMPERVMRSIAPEKYQPSAKAGMIRYCQSRNQNGSHVEGAPHRKFVDPLPRTGSQPSSMPKMMIKTMPTKKPGMDSPTSAIILPRLSHQVFTFSADSIPSGTPITMEMTKAEKPSLSEFGNRSK